MSIDHYPADYRILVHQPVELRAGIVDDDMGRSALAHGPGRPFCEIHLPSDWQCGPPLIQVHRCPCGQWVAVRGSVQTYWFPLAGPRGLLLEWTRHEYDYGNSHLVTGYVFDRYFGMIEHRRMTVRHRLNADLSSVLEAVRAEIRRDLLAEHGEVEDAAGVEWTSEALHANYLLEHLRAEVSSRVFHNRVWFGRATDFNRAFASKDVPDVPVSDHGIEGAIPLPPDDPHSPPGPYLPWHEQNRRINELLCRRADRP